MTKCATCGMPQKGNSLHDDDYKGEGKHPYKEATPMKSLTEIDKALDLIDIFDGGELKSMGHGKVGGYLVRYTSEADPDLTGDYFTPNTNFYKEEGDFIPIMYDHGLNGTMKGQQIGRASVHFDDVGMFIKGELDLRKKYVRAINDKLIKGGNAGLSSGAARHMTRRKSSKSGANEILDWGVAEGSVTVAPVEPRCEVMSLKSYMAIRQDPFDTFDVSDDEGEDFKSSTEDLEEDDEVKSIKKEKVEGKTQYCVYKGKKKIGSYPTMPEAEDAMDEEDLEDGADDEEEEDQKSLSGFRALKSAFDDKLAEKKLGDWEIRNVRDEVIADIAQAALLAPVSGNIIDIRQKVAEAVAECAVREQDVIANQVEKWVANGGKDDNSPVASCDGPKVPRFYLRSLVVTERGPEAGLNLGEHSTKMVSILQETEDIVASVDRSVKAYTDRCENRITFRANDPSNKSGKLFSPAQTERLTEMSASFKALMTTLAESQARIDNMLAIVEAPRQAASETGTGMSPLEVQQLITRNQVANTLAGA